MINLDMALEHEQHIIHTENGARSYDSTMSKVYDLFAMGGALRTAPEERIQKMVKEAFEEAPNLTVRCLFYLRDIKEGQGERRVFRVGMKFLVDNYTEIADKFYRVITEIPTYGRWDDLYTFVGTKLEPEVFKMIKNQLLYDYFSPNPSLLGKWLKSENASSKKTRALAKITMKYLGLSPKEYREILSSLRSRIDILERKMSEGQWDKINYSKIPSVAGLKYTKAFIRHDGERYRTFMDDKNTTVNAKVLYPYDVVHYAFKNHDRAIANKYWDNLTDYFKGKSFDGIAVVDTSSSMSGRPIEVALSLGYYCAERAKGPFHNKMITFSNKPRYISINKFGDDFYSRIKNIFDLDICQTTNIEGVFDLLLNTVLKYKLSQSDLPEYVIIISDMEFNMDVTPVSSVATLMESIRQKWKFLGFDMPKLVYWNVNSHQNNIPELNKDVSFISGFSPIGYDMILSGKTGVDLMLDKLLSRRYAVIRLE